MIQLLDHGYIKLIESWGSDERIIEAARMSTNKGFLGWGGNLCPSCVIEKKLPAHLYEADCNICKGTGYTLGDEKLLSYLYKNKHMTPFEMAGMVIEVQAPIFVFREWHRHRTQSYNELSARYTELPNLFYMPNSERLINSSKQSKNKQESGSKELNKDDLGIAFNEISLAYSQCRGIYEGLLDQGISKEIARLVIPVAQYSRMRASANLRNWLAFMTLRCSSNAQYEIRCYANVIADLISERFPRTFALWAQENEND